MNKSFILICLGLAVFLLLLSGFQLYAQYKGGEGLSFSDFLVPSSLLLSCIVFINLWRTYKRQSAG